MPAQVRRGARAARAGALRVCPRIGSGGGRPLPSGWRVAETTPASLMAFFMVCFDGHTPMILTSLSMMMAGLTLRQYSLALSVGPLKTSISTLSPYSFLIWSISLSTILPPEHDGRDVKTSIFNPILFNPQFQEAACKRLHVRADAHQHYPPFLEDHCGNHS